MECPACLSWVEPPQRECVCGEVVRLTGEAPEGTDGALETSVPQAPTPAFALAPAAEAGWGLPDEAESPTAEAAWAQPAEEAGFTTGASWPTPDEGHGLAAEGAWASPEAEPSASAEASWPAPDEEASPDAWGMQQDGPAALTTMPGPDEGGERRPSRKKVLNRLKFGGDGQTLFKIMAVNVALTLATVGIYRFWARAKLRRYLYSQLSLRGHRFAYHGTGKEGLRGFAKIVGIGAVLGLVLASSAAALAPIFPQALGKQAAMALAGAIVNLATLCLAVLLGPLLQVSSWRYQLSRTSLNGVRFSFRGTYGEAFWLNLRGVLLCGLTLGLYTPWFLARQQRFKLGNTYYGNRSFESSLTGGQLARPLLIGSLLLPLTSGLSLFWTGAAVQREIAASTRFGKARFENAVTGWGLLKWTAVGLAARLLTVGIALPWARVATMRYLAGCLTVRGSLGLEAIRQEALDASAMGDAMVEDSGIDDFGL